MGSDRASQAVELGCAALVDAMDRPRLRLLGSWLDVPAQDLK